jgi:long-chain acyl-CoA synthetase
MGIREEVQAQLTGPGGPFEIVEEEVLGERMNVLESRPRSLRQMLENSAAHGDKEHLVHGERRITFAEHVRLVASTARALEERYQIGKGDVVAILSANSPDWPILFWATVSLGGIVAALNGWWTADEIEYGLQRSEPKLLVGERRLLARIDDRKPGIPIVELDSQASQLFEYAPDAELPTTPIAEDDPAVILFTSGTTGRPKGAVSSHRGIVGFVLVNIAAGAISLVADARRGDAPAQAPQPAQQTALVTSPMFHLSGLYAMIAMQLHLGGKLVTRSGRFDPGEVLQLI